MKLDIVRTKEEFAGLSKEWNELLDISASHVPFLRHEYLYTWWQTLGGGEWPHGELLIITARHEDDSLAGIAPLFHTQNRDAKAAIMFLGSVEISDYLDLIARPDNLDNFVEALYNRLIQSDVPDWDLLDFYNILESSPTLQSMQTSAEKAGWEYAQENLHHCPFIPLPGEWDEYLAGINKKQRHEIRRKIRRAESDERSIRWYIVDDEKNLDEEMEDFLQLMAQDQEKQAFLTGVMRTQMSAAVRAAFRENWLQLAFLEIDGNKAAGYLNFDFGDQIWVYNSGLDFEYASLSPGWVLLAYLLRWSNENERKTFDFLRGDEQYKYRFGAVDRSVVRVQVTR